MAYQAKTLKLQYRIISGAPQDLQGDIIDSIIVVSILLGVALINYSTSIVKMWRLNIQLISAIPLRYSDY